MRYSVMSVQDHYPKRERTVPELYAQVLAQAKLAETLGYDTFFVAEHHFHEYGAVPNPAVMLAAMAQRTKTLRLGTAISVLTFHSPLTVAETYAMIDVVSNGRLVLGVGSGYLKHEFEGYRIDPAEKRERFDESLEVLKQILSGKRVTYKGRHIQVDDVAINVLPIQKPLPPIYVAILRREAAYHIGRKGQRIVCVPYASVDRFEEVGEIVAEYRKGQRDGGIVESEEDVLIALHTHVAESHTEASKRAAAPFELYVESRLYAKRQTFEDVEKSGLSLIGGMETVRDKLQALHQMGVNHVLALHNFGLIEQDLVFDSMRRFAELSRAAGKQTRAAAKVA